ncbi:MAG: hypothetical protein LBG27_00440 [Spirochaetaceae bacterium]|jgi:hypothetical protein|nr:hypothetical protein [Spirochaetaceae bacterium]
MKFRCDRSFEHSGARSYTKGRVYDIAPETAGELIALDKKREKGALEYFTPADEAAAAFVKDMNPEKPPEPVKPKEPDGNKPPEPVKPAKARLTAEAEALGIKPAGKEKNAETAALIAAKKAGSGTGNAGGAAR